VGLLEGFHLDVLLDVSTRARRSLLLQGGPFGMLFGAFVSLFIKHSFMPLIYGCLFEDFHFLLLLNFGQKSFRLIRCRSNISPYTISNSWSLEMIWIIHRLLSSKKVLLRAIIAAKEV
jgi:hypothetical protein